MRELAPHESYRTAQERQRTQFNQLYRAAHISSKLHEVLDIHPGAVVEIPLQQGGEETMRADRSVMRMADVILAARCHELSQQGWAGAVKETLDHYFPQSRHKASR